MAVPDGIPDASVFEKLGAFYLGRTYDLERDAVAPELVLYDSKDLTTHAVCVGMTGSGKTGLCLSLLEEAAIDGIPCLAIDPKGDLGNLLLTFPQLRAEDFRPWIDEGEAARKGATPDQYAEQVAARWRDGLAEWGQDGARIARLRGAADLAIYTPGSSAGIPIAILRSLAAPPAAVVSDGDALRDRVAATASGLLALLGIDADPVRSREHILLSNIFQLAWQDGRDLELASLIAQVQNPPLDKIGVMAVDAFYPPSDRMELSLRLNGLVASPSFAGWLEGEPLDVQRLLWAPDGRPRIAIVSLAHLSDAERMFFVTLLLNEVIAWMRSQAGTPSLRALLYMDEVFGYFPPTANPPSKTPMLTLLKQARAYGLGVVLATQNPVDLDYKGLSNAGTWFLGRLQTERDKLRVIEGLEGASATAGAGFDRQRTERLLAGLKNRLFLMHNVHDDAPVLFHTRWALSYLRGPLTRAQIQTLMAGRTAPASAGPAPMPRGKAAEAPAGAAESGTARPAVPPEARETFVAPAVARPAGVRLLYRPALIGSADLHFVNAKAGIDLWKSASYVASLEQDRGPDAWDGAELFGGSLQGGGGPPEPGSSFAALPTRATDARSYGTWEKAFRTHLYRESALTLYRSPAFKLTSEPGESEADFRIRLRQVARERRDADVEKLCKKYAPKLARLQERIRKAEQRLGRERSQYEGQKLQTAISMGATVLGAFLGRRVASVGTVGRATTAARGVGRAAREKEDVERAQRDIAALQQQMADLEIEFQRESGALEAAVDPATLDVSEEIVRPRKTDITINRVALHWLPWWVDAQGVAAPAYP
jgi:hypothetical protein